MLVRIKLTSYNAGYGYSIQEAPPLLVAHVRLNGVHIRPACVTFFYLERTNIRARAANKQTIAKTLFLQ